MRTDTEYLSKGDMAALLDLFAERNIGRFSVTQITEKLKSMVDRMPKADVLPIKEGRFVSYFRGLHQEWIYCTGCENRIMNPISNPYKQCPYCGMFRREGRDPEPAEKIEEDEEDQ